MWISDCVRGHKKCRMSKQNYLPTRLLDLQAFQGSEDVRLVSLNLKLEHSETEYITLSHCWGFHSEHPITTRKDSLEQRMRRITFDDLSRTFQDAVRITRNLDQRYLWIDSLCIIQDDKEDWVREAAAMAKVYSGSLCTLSALNSKNSNEGCRLGVSGRFSHSRYLDLDFSLRRVRIFMEEPVGWHSEYGDDPYRHEGHGRNPLRQRAWTLQERELSIRNIHFGPNLLLWECKEKKGSNQLPWHEKKLEDDFQPWPIRNSPSESLGLDGPVSLRERWYELMEDYSSRSLTKEEDKLPALSGLASKFQEHFPAGQYLAGLWSNHLPAALLWKVIHRAPLARSCNDKTYRPMSYVAPSWSWASIYGEITYESQRLEHVGERPEESTADYDFGDLALNSIHIQPKNADPFGEISNAFLVLRARIVSVDSIPETIKDEYNNKGSMAVLKKDGISAGVFYPDDMNELQDADRIFCLRVKSVMNSIYGGMRIFVYILCYTTL